MIQTLLAFVIYLLIIGLILWLIDYAAQMLPLPPPFAQVIRIVVSIIGVILVIYLLLGLIGAAPFPSLRY